MATQADDPLGIDAGEEDNDMWDDGTVLIGDSGDGDHDLTNQAAASGTGADVQESSSEEEDNDELMDNDEPITLDGVDATRQQMINAVRRKCDILYIKAPRIHLDLMHDFTDSDLFTIDGDSILADIFAQYGLDNEHGGQLLHLVYLVELFFKDFQAREGKVHILFFAQAESTWHREPLKLLARQTIIQHLAHNTNCHLDFQEREGKFHILFFTQAESIWHKEPLKLLARQTIIQHLALNTNCHLVTVIPHPFSQEWKDYVEHYHPAFVMLSDGESLDKTQGQCTLLRLLLRSALSLDVDCAFLSPLDRALRSVNTFYVEARKVEVDIKRMKISQESLADTYDDIAQSLRSESAQCYTEQELQKMGDNLTSIIKEHDGNEQKMTTSRDVVSVIACAEVIKAALCNGDETEKVFMEGAAKAFILHDVLLQYLPLESRAQNIPTCREGNISSYSHNLMDVFLTKVHYALAKLVTSFDTLRMSGIAALQETKSLSDLMDGRLLHVTLYLLQQYTEKDIQASYRSEVLSKFQYLWKVTCALACGDDNVKSLNDDVNLATAPLYIYQDTKGKLASKSSNDAIDRGLAQVTSKLVMDYAEDLVKELATNRGVPCSSASSITKRTFEETYHWHTGTLLPDDLDRTRDTEEKSTFFRVDVVDMCKELGLPVLRRLYSDLGVGLLEHEIKLAESRGFGTDQKAIQLHRMWRDKQGGKRWRHVDFVEKLEALGHREASERLHTKWVAAAAKDNSKELKEKQKFGRYMVKYGESLEGKSHGIQQQTIIVEKNQDKARDKQRHGGHKGQKKKQVMTSKEKILHEKGQKDREKAHKDAEKKWSTILPSIKSDISGSRLKAALKTIDDYMHHCNSNVLTVQAMMAKIECYWLAWKHVHSSRKTDAIQPSLFSDVTDTHPMYYPIMMFVCCQDLLEYKEKLNKKQVQLMGAFVRGLGFHSLAKHIEDLAVDQASSQKSSVKPLFSVKCPVADECSIGMTSARFQLQFVGQWLKRDDRTDRDPRVAHFIPDGWQRELLDVVDNNESALIVAPTSSGKTYASYYCMEKVLRRSDEGIVVYVSPTKALMNQVSATIYARYHKNLPPGKVVCGVFSRDFRRNALNCQILVTVPQCLEILLLSPLRQEWAKKIEYVIFDEVHCLGGEIGAEVWEHLLVAIKCPFLALSATIRNPEHLSSWLQASQDFKQKQAEEVANQGGKKKNKKQTNADRIGNNAYKVRLVVYKERHSDLEKFVYLPKPSKSIIMPNDAVLSDTSGFVPLHPCAVLDLKKMKARGLPSDLSLSPREALVLYDTMHQVYPDCQQMKKLQPEVYFKEKPIVKKKDARKYENALKEEMKRWLKKEQEGERKLSEVVSKLNHGVHNEELVCREAWKDWDQKVPKSGVRTKGGIFSDEAAKKGFSQLIRQLNEQNKLPAIVFSQSRYLCEKLASKVAESLAVTEVVKRTIFEQTEEYKKAERAASKMDKDAKRSRDAVSKEKKQKDDEKAGDEREGLDLGEARYYLSKKPLPSCTLQGEGNMTEEELAEELERLPEGHTSENLCRLIARGVAYHHAGLNNKLRTAVEKLFRMKQLKVVIATATLALGIHMPCKTVVFVCEDLWLKPLAFRQMAGRSGRRGFDLVGNVIFYCIPRQKIQHLITSGLPHLRGHFPFSVSFVLRLMVLTHNSNDQRDAHEKVLALLKHPFVCHKAADMEEVVKHFFLFSVDYLIHAGLLTPDGTPIGLSGLATHLFYHEPANLTFVSLLQHGAFHKLCSKKKMKKDGTFPESVMDTLVLVLAHMFGRSVMPMSLAKTIRAGGVHSKVVFEDPLPEPFSSILKKHNNDVMNVFRNYVHTVCEHAAKREDSVKQNVLPLSQVAIHSGDTSQSSSREQGDFVADLKASANQSTTLSPFVMTSGHRDEDLHMFDTDIKQAIRQGVHIEHSKIPTLVPSEDLEDRRGKPLFINAYAYDFFKHGSKKLVEQENRLQSGEVFDKLNDFRLAIAAISVALTDLGPEKDNVVRAFQQLKNEYYQIFGTQFQGIKNVF